MTDYYNTDSVRATLENYHAAMQRLFAVSPRLVPLNNPWADPMPTQWKLYTMDDGLHRHATEVNTRYHKLSPHTPIRPPFFSVQAYFKTTFMQVGWNRAAPGHDAVGLCVPEQKTCRFVHLSLALYEHAWTAEQFIKHEGDIRALFDEAGDDVRSNYRKAVACAWAEIDRYNALLADLKPLVKGA